MRAASWYCSTVLQSGSDVNLRICVCILSTLSLFDSNFFPRSSCSCSLNLVGEVPPNEMLERCLLRSSATQMYFSVKTRKGLQKLGGPNCVMRSAIRFEAETPQIAQCNSFFASDVTALLCSANEQETVVILWETLPKKSWDVGVLCDQNRWDFKIMGH